MILSMMNENLGLEQVDEVGNVETEEFHDENNIEQSNVNTETQLGSDQCTLMLNDNDFEVFYRLLCEGKRGQKWNDTKSLKPVFHIFHLL